MQNLNLNIAVNDTEYDLTLMFEECKTEGWVYAIETFTFQNLNTELAHGFK